MPGSRPRSRWGGKRRASRWGSFALALVLVLSTAGLLVAVEPSPREASAEDVGARLTVDSMTPTITPETKHVRVTGSVENTGSLPLENVVTYFWFPEDSAPLTTRDELAAVAAEQPDPSGDGRHQWPPGQLSVNVATTLAPGATARFTLNVPVETLRNLTLNDAGDPGVYLVGVDVRATPPGWDQRLTRRVRTFLPWLPRENRLTPVEVAFLLPLVGRPDVVSRRDDTVLDEDAASAFAPGGRLSTILALSAEHEVSLLVDPAILEKAEVMADGYHTWALDEFVRTGSADARDWLQQARGLLATRDSLMLPYGDPDVAALSHNDLGEVLAQAVRESESAAVEYHTSGTVLAWPGTGYADTETLEDIAASGASTVLLSQDALPRLEDDGTSPTASFVTAEGGLKALVSDPALTSGRPGDGANPLFVQQRLLAETALLAMGGGSPEELRRVIAAFPRDWNPTPADEKLFELVESTSWLRPVSASAVLSHFPTAYGGPITYPKRERAAELGDRLIEDLRELSGTAETYLDMLAEEQDNRVELERAFLRGTSMSWRGSQARAARLVGAMRTDTAAKMSRVLLTAPALVTLSSDTGPFPLTITNGSRDEPIEVRVELTPSDPSVLDIEPTEPIQIGPGRKNTVSVTARARTGRALEVTARLVTPNGTPIPGTSPTTFDVQVKAYGQVGWIIIGCGVALLFVATVVRVVRRVHRTLADRRRRGGNLTGSEPSKERV